MQPHHGWQLHRSVQVRVQGEQLTQPRHRPAGQPHGHQYVHGTTRNPSAFPARPTAPRSSGSRSPTGLLCGSQKPAVLNPTCVLLPTGYMSTNDAYSTANVVNGRFDRANSSDRILAGCTNSLCAVAVDLGFLYTNITQFRAYTGYPSCSPGNRVCNEEGQYFNTMGDCSHYIQVWTGSVQTSLADANAALGGVDSDAAGWMTVVAHPRPSRYGEEHPTMNPPVAGRFVRYLTDNRYAATSPGEGCARGNRWLRLYEFEVLTHATEEYTCGADGLSAASTRDLQCSLETSRNSGG